MKALQKKTSLGSLKEWKRSKCAAGKIEISLGRRGKAKKAGLLVLPSKKANVNFDQEKIAIQTFLGIWVGKKKSSRARQWK